MENQPRQPTPLRSVDFVMGYSFGLLGWLRFSGEGVGKDVAKAGEGIHLPGGMRAVHGGRVAGHGAGVVVFGGQQVEDGPDLRRAFKVPLQKADGFVAVQIGVDGLAEDGAEHGEKTQDLKTQDLTG